MARNTLDPNAVLGKYCWGLTKPYGVQIETVKHLISNPRAYCLNAMGTGKTFCTLAAYDVLRLSGRVKKALIVAPLSTLKFAWVAEVIKSFPHLRVEVLHGTKTKRLKTLAIDADLYIINHDGFDTIKDAIYKKPDIDLLVLDELAAYRNGSAGRTKLIRDYAKYIPYVWGLTGAPMPRNVTDVWAQCSIITPHTVPKYFKHCLYALCEKDGPFSWVARPGAIERAVAMMSPSVRYSLDDVIELPDQVITYVPTDMGPKQAEIYNAMRNKAVAMIGTSKIDALNAGAVLSKLLQIAIGWVYARDGTVVTLDNNARVAAIIDAVEASEGKVLVFLPFKSALAAIGEVLKRAGIKHAVVSGDTPAGQRNIIFDAFQNRDPELKVLLAHPACLAHGITLTAANTVIWGGPVTSLEIFNQACARIRRIGQTKKQYIIMLGGTVVERKIYSLLGLNDQTQQHFLQLLSNVTSDAA